MSFTKHYYKENEGDVNFEKAGGENEYYGYKVMAVDNDRKNFISGADSRIKLPVKIGSVHTMHRYGIFMNNNPDYVVSYYSYKEDEDDPHEYVIKYKFNLDDVVDGKNQLQDKEPEIGVKSATVVDLVDIDDWNKGKRFK